MHPNRSAYKDLYIVFLVTLVAICTIAYKYTTPEQLYWDESYHIASAQKYLSGVFFMEPHPPLGKLLIAAGEALLNANPDDTSFTTTDHASVLPPGFSFAGYRLFPVICSVLSVPLFFIFLMQLSGNRIISFVLSIALALDNAYVVHSRAAMLDGIQLFFIFATLAGIAATYRRIEHASLLKGIPYITGLAWGGALATKATSLIVAPFFAILIAPLWSKRWQIVRIPLQILGATLLVYLCSWYTHTAIGKRVEPNLPNRGFYQSSDETKRIISIGETNSLDSIWPLLRDNMAFFSHYERGVPKLNMCNQNESGSTPVMWPFGARTINYRWDKKDGKVSYTYLVANPLVWAIGLFSLISSAALWISSILGRCAMPREWKLFSGTLLLMWCGYMVVMASLDRVMYLYHYLIPLALTLSLGAITIPQVRLTQSRYAPPTQILYLIIALMILVTFRYYAPLTYGYPLTNRELSARALFDTWDLRCPECNLTNHLAQPICNPKEKRFPQINISNVFATDSFQEWGEPIQGLSVEKQQVFVAGKRYDSVIGTHANSTLRFPLSKRYLVLKGRSALPDYLKTKDGKAASVIFEIWLDGVQIWRSRPLTPHDQQQEFELSLVGGSILELRTLDAGDGNYNDHAVWIETKFEPARDPALGD